MTAPSNHDETPLRLLLAARSSRKPRKDRDGPRPDEGIGIQTQDELARKWAEREGHVIVDVAADTASGSVPPWYRKNLRPWVACGCSWCRDQDDRRGVPDKKRVYDSSRITRFDGILAFKVDRLSRGDDQDFALIEGWASHHGKKLVIVDGPQFPSRGDSDYWQWAAQRREAFKELENIKERAERGRKKLTENKAMIGKPPFGLEVTGEKYFKTIAPTEQGRELVPKVFDKIIAGDSMGSIAAWLTQQTGREFRRKSVRDMVYCATYLGERRNAGGRTVLTCEPLLVTADGKPDWGRFRAAQRMLSAHPKRGPRTADVLLTGVLWCGAPGCTARMYRHVAASGGRRYVYYQCARECGNRARLDWADMAVDAIITKTQDRPVVDYRLVPGDDHEAEKQAVREAMAQLPLLELPDDEFDKRMKDLRAERDRVNALVPVPARYDEVETGEGTYAEAWARLDPAGRSAFLAKRHFRVYATKEFVRLERGEGEWTCRAYYDRQLGVIGEGDDRLRLST